MPRIKALFIVAVLAAWLVLAFPAGAVHFPDSPDGTRPAARLAEGIPIAAGILTSEKPAAADAPSAPRPPNAASASMLAALPHKAIAGSVVAGSSLSASRPALERPFTDAYRQTPEFTYLYGSRGEGRYVLHTGVDIVNPLGTPVRAVADGQVVFAGSDTLQVFGPRPDYYGNLVITRLDGTREAEPVYVLFGHLNTVLVDPGQPVKAGDVIGLVGMTGIAIGPHLHLEVRQGQNNYQSTRNPALWLSSLPGRGTLAGRIVDEAGEPVAGERLLVYQAERPNQVWRVVRSYLDSPLVHGDEVEGENFALPDVPAGDYFVVAGRAGATIRIPVRIEPGRLAQVEIRVERGP
jgi:murein DD-endopeptidase MepM/ murein hydrolase activator NlpD